MSYGIPTAAGGPAGSPPVCPRHPERVSYIRCQRCGRPACTECQRPAAVGIQCVDCVREQNRGMRQRLTPTGARLSSGQPIVTYAIIALCVIVFLLEFVPSLGVVQNLAYAPVYTQIQPYRMITSAFVHSQGFILHILLNMYSLWVLGRMMESTLGRVRFGAVFLISALGGSVAVLLFANPLGAVVGASGGIFGLFAALLINQLKNKGDLRGIAVLLVINLALSFFGAGISWQAHVGGLVTGALLSLVFLYTPAGKARNLIQIGGVIVVLLILLMLSLLRLAQLAPIFAQYDLAP